MRGKLGGTQHPSVSALEEKIIAEDWALTPEQREVRYQRACKIVAREVDDPTDRPDKPSNDVTPPRYAALQARRHLMSLEARFFAEAHTRWPRVRFRRYSPISIIPALGERPSVWYAPFLCRPKKLIIVIEDRPDFPYRIYGQNRNLYERHGYTVLDFSEDFSCPTNDSVWEAAMAMIDRALAPTRQAA